MFWKKSGIIIEPQKQYKWSQSHCALPTALHLRGCLYRIYFATRDAQNRSHTSYADVDFSDNVKVLNYARKPVLEPGMPGHFDDCGAIPTSIVRNGSKIFLYYVGWNTGKSDPIFYTSAGLAISEDNGNTFKKYGPPIMERSQYDPWAVLSYFVRKEENAWKMWYVSGLGFKKRGNKISSYYNIKYATSSNGIDWKRDGTTCLDFSSKKETNIARPWVILEEGIYKMWFCYNKGKGYRIGYAQSKDGIKWKRKDNDFGLDVTNNNWDSEITTYPCIIECNGNKALLYNGNGYGKEGIGLATSKIKI
ncbi:MAG: hypothetical protein WC449_00440 [Candidatus Paceibacterota bacterium]